MKWKPEVQAVLDALRAASQRFEIVGEARRGEHITKVEVVCVGEQRTIKDPDDFFADKVVSSVDDEVDKQVRAGRLTRSGSKVYLAGTYVPLVVHNATKRDFASKVVTKTGPQNFIIEVATMAKGLGYAWKGAGFQKWDHRAEGPDWFTPETEAQFFEFLKMPWTDPKVRKYNTTTYKGAPDNQEPLTEAEMRAWARSSRWIDSTCAGEAHQWTSRTAQASDEMFLRVVKMARDYGYAGFYKGRHYRYLDLDGWFYFTQGYKWNETQLVNRKRLAGAEAREAHPWKRNLTPFALSSTSTD